MQNKVLIIYKCVPHYRAPFFDQLRKKLSQRGIHLDLVYGDGDLDFRSRGGMVSVPWGIPVNNHILRIFGVELLWQPVLKYIRGYDLIISMQESKLLANYILFILQLLGGPKVALWGHGRTVIAERFRGLKDLFKKSYSRLPFWWFAYTAKGRDIICSLGYPAAKITVVENAINTVSLRELAARLSAAEKQKMLDKYGLEGRNTCIYCGALYREKDLPFLFKTCDILAKNIHNFELIVVGAGEERSFVEEKARECRWLKYFGDRYGEEQAELFNCAKLLLMPGRVGLAILDSFIFGKPIVTTENPYHAPEIDYLDNGRNGVMTRYDVQEYALAIMELLEDNGMYDRIQKGALESGKRYSVNRMADNFALGVEKALAHMKKG